ncbi:hypothetical protein GPECTOR_13g850 [Gonium pectorale]|uniref:Protein kinase domain-containing protein n=1 Tax=Gonium pectorale TaxID=33097 RepID=A0A150GNI9_GONPE|nr:hypothetical protein GPECTOR_13g850 [Gonium pectorale]|eukprot:KXZ51361.1 hypothetical protein GPECTOR_13g850 [Gonium pectorale]
MRKRPDFLCWLDNVLLFKGEERAEEADLQDAIAALASKMPSTWHPELLPGVAKPVMLAYAAAGDVLQFFSVHNKSGRIKVDPISSRCDLGTPLGRAQALHGTFNIVRLLASYKPGAPRVPVALGGVVKATGALGEPIRAVTFYEEFAEKCIYNFEERHAGVNDFGLLVVGGSELYTNTTLAQCPNLARLHTPDAIRLSDTTLVLHLVPAAGVPQRGPPSDEARLQQAVRGVLAGIEALHSAGFVHRDIRWDNVIWVPGAAPGAAGTFVLIDLEHAARADSAQDCRQPPFPLAPWPEVGILDPADGRYTPASDLCLVAHCLLTDLPFKLSAGGADLRRALAARELDARGALAHEWLAGV